MNRTTRVAIAFVSLATVLGGCTFTRNKQDLIKTDAVDIEATPAPNATYVYTSVYQDGVKLYISGRVALEYPKATRRNPGHMDITARSGDGELLMISHSPYMKLSRSGKHNQVDFYTAARLLLPKGSIVTFEHHWAEIGVHDQGINTSNS